MQGRRCNPSFCALKRLPEKIVREFGHGDLQVFGLMVEDGYEEPANCRNVVSGLGHGVTSSGNAGR
jgi:hypothetical protein